MGEAPGWPVAATENIARRVTLEDRASCANSCRRSDVETRSPRPLVPRPRGGDLAVRAVGRGAVELHGPDPEPVRPRRAVRVLLLEPRAVVGQPVDVRVTPGLS